MRVNKVRHQVLTTHRDQTLSRFSKRDGKQNLISLTTAESITLLFLPFQKKGGTSFSTIFWLSDTANHPSMLQLIFLSSAIAIHEFISLSILKYIQIKKKNLTNKKPQAWHFEPDHCSLLKHGAEHKVWFYGSLRQCNSCSSSALLSFFLCIKPCGLIRT